MPLGSARAVIISRGAELVFGTVQTAAKGNSGNYVTTFNFGSMNPGTAGKAVVILSWIHAGASSGTAIGANPALTLNGQAMTKLLDSVYDAGSDRFKYGQSLIAWIDSPQTGDLVFTTNVIFPTAAATFIPVNGAPAGAPAFGTPDIALLGNVAAVPNSITTATAGSRILIATAKRNPSTTFTWDNGAVVELASGAGAQSTEELPRRHGWLAAPTAGAYTVGGTFGSAGSTSDSWGHNLAIELKAAA